MQAGSGAEARIALFQERPHALALVGCAEQIQEEPTLPRDALRTGRDECGADGGLGGRERLPRTAGERPSRLDRRGKHVGRRYHAVGDAEAAGLVGPHETPE